MAMTIKQARGMFPGNQLTFGDNPAVFEVVEVQQRAGGVYLVLKRDDEYETFATEKDLDVANLVPAAKPEENPYLTEIAALKQQLEQAQAVAVDDPPSVIGAEPETECAPSGFGEISTAGDPGAVKAEDSSGGHTPKKGKK